MYGLQEIYKGVAITIIPQLPKTKAPLKMKDTYMQFDYFYYIQFDYFEMKVFWLSERMSAALYYNNMSYFSSFTVQSYGEILHFSYGNQ